MVAPRYCFHREGSVLLFNQPPSSMKGTIAAKEKGSQAECITKFFELANTELFNRLQRQALMR
jgi:hypothetical protein